MDFNELRLAIVGGTAEIAISPLRPDEIGLIAWSGSRTHLENVLRQLQRVESGEVEYLALRAAGLPVAKGGIDFAKEPGAGTIWQVATHPQLEGLGVATRLIRELEARAMRRGLTRLRLAVDVDNARARRLYEYLGYDAIGESEGSWEAEAADGSTFLRTATLTEMLKTV